MYCNKLSESRGLTPVYTKEVEGKDETDISLWGEVPEKANKEWNEIKWNKEANGYRLLTEAEWEFAAKGGKLTSGKTSAGFDFYDDNVEYYVWAGINSKQLTHEVGLKEKNELGLYDMNGNVWEWCRNPRYTLLDDFNNDKFSIEVESLTGEYAIRGGSFLCHASYCHRYRVAGRNGVDHMSTSSHLGFRCIKK